MSQTNETTADVVWLTAENLAENLRGLPRKVAFAMRTVTMLRYGSVRITIPGGRTFAYDAPEAGPHGEATFHNWGIVRRVLSQGSLGVAESYLEGEWDSPDTTSFLELFLLNSYDEAGASFFTRSKVLNLFNAVWHRLRANSKSQARKNIAAHYDLGNAFYEQWLDPSMTYSSAYYGKGANDLESAQTAKYKALADAMDLRAEHHVLEIGCGWGGFAEYAAGTVGARVTCLTISEEQFAYARDRMDRLGLSDRVTIKFQDYRDETGTYDRIGSIEMFEAVGEAYWPTYFAQVHDRLKPGGKAGLQIISIRDSDYAHYRANPDFIQKYIFPGGMLPSPAMVTDMAAKAGLRQEAELSFGRDYAATLEEWRQRFWAAWPTIEPLGFDNRFKRMWEFYMHYCEAGFLVGSIDVRQTVFARA
ncbi:MAG: cyclopropane-fatty-acyl-phospholipid synthase family protein [Pseudomonadota bacterium]